jgi:hypothetical protein
MPKKPYTPSLSRLNICTLYHEAKYRQIPMTKLADELVGKGLSSSVGMQKARDQLPEWKIGLDCER